MEKNFSVCPECGKKPELITHKHEENYLAYWRCPDNHDTRPVNEALAIGVSEKDALQKASAGWEKYAGKSQSKKKDIEVLDKDNNPVTTVSDDKSKVVEEQVGLYKPCKTCFTASNIAENNSKDVMNMFKITVTCRSGPDCSNNTVNGYGLSIDDARKQAVDSWNRFFGTDTVNIPPKDNVEVDSKDNFSSLIDGLSDLVSKYKS